MYEIYIAIILHLCDFNALVINNRFNLLYFRYQNMNYQETIDFLFQQLPIFQRQGKAAYKANLDNTHAFDAYLNYPHRSFKSIHVAGTNGKGSVSHMLARVLQEAGYKTGLHTSPHMLDLRERVKVNGVMMEQEFVVEFVETHRAFILELQPSFFEMMVMMAFDYFRQQKVDVAIIEVGMGGRLDSTNILKPDLCLITNIGLDHVQFLGDSLPKIAAEKAGIIKPDTPVVIGEKHPETAEVFTNKALEVKAPLFFAEEHFHVNEVNYANNHQNLKIANNGKSVELSLDLLGRYQQKNVLTALCGLQQLMQLGYKIEEQDIKMGLSQVIATTGLLGRWQKVQESPLLIADTGHNKEGLTYIVEQIAEQKFEKLHMVIGLVNEKDAEIILSLFPENAQYYLCQADIPRSMPLDQLKATAERLHLHFDGYDSVNSAVQNALQHANEADMIYIGGSTFVVAEALQKLQPI